MEIIQQRFVDVFFSANLVDGLHFAQMHFYEGFDAKQRTDQGSGSRESSAHLQVLKAVKHSVNVYARRQLPQILGNFARSHFPLVSQFDCSVDEKSSPKRTAV